jgi:hypothetical protein
MDLPQLLPPPLPLPLQHPQCPKQWCRMQLHHLAMRSGKQEYEKTCAACYVEGLIPLQCVSVSVHAP